MTGEKGGTHPHGMPLFLKVADSMVGDLELFVYDVGARFKLIYALDGVVMQINLFFKLFEPIPYQRRCFAVREKRPGKRTDKREDRDNDAVIHCTPPRLPAAP